MSNLEELMPVLQRAKESGRSILLICDNISGSALQLLVKNYVEDRIDVCVVKSPSGGLNKKELLEDVAIYTGGKVFGGVFGDDLKNFDPKVLGVADVITVDSQYTVIRSKPNKEAIAARVETIDNALIKEKNDQYRVEHLRLRRAGLTSGIALINSYSEIPIGLFISFNAYSAVKLSFPLHSNNPIVELSSLSFTKSSTADK